MPAKEEYEDFRRIIIERNSVMHSYLNEMMEQIYDQSNLYWHVSPSKFSAFVNDGRPTFISRRVDFFFKGDHRFNVLKNDEFNYAYAIKLAKPLDIFNPKYPKDLAKIQPIISEFLLSQNNTERPKLQHLWNSYIDTGYWEFIERDGNSYMLNRILWEVLVKEYEGFLSGTGHNYGSMGIFDSKNLNILGDPLSIETFIKFYNGTSNTNGTVYKYPFNGIDTGVILNAKRKTENLRSDDEKELLNALKFLL